MKRIKTMAFVAAILPMLLSCSGGSGSSSESVMFGSLPGVYSQFQTEKDKLSEEAKNISSEADKAKLIEKSEKMKEDWGTKIEESAKTLDGKPIEFAESDIKVTAPISLQFDGFTSAKSDLLPKFKVNGSAEATTDINTDAIYVGVSESVYIVGYNEAGEQVYKIKVGFVPSENVDGKAVIKAGTPISFDVVHFSPKYLNDYEAAKTLKLEVCRN